MDEPRRCESCGKRLARLNREPRCFACQMSRPPETVRRRSRQRLPHDEILRLHRELGSTQEVARRLGLARSSVWSVVRRAADQEHAAKG